MFVCFSFAQLIKYSTATHCNAWIAILMSVTILVRVFCITFLNISIIFIEYLCHDSLCQKSRWTNPNGSMHTWLRCLPKRTFRIWSTVSLIIKIMSIILIRFFLSNNLCFSPVPLIRCTMIMKDACRPAYALVLS